jgi:putative oxidoreductase
MNTPPLHRTHRGVVWGIRLLLALAFGTAGVATLAGAPQMVEVFDAVGAGHGFRHVMGGLEIGGVVLLLIPSTGFFGGWLLEIGGSSVPVVVLGLLSAFVAWCLRPAAVAVLGS